MFVNDLYYMKIEWSEFLVSVVYELWILLIYVRGYVDIVLKESIFFE